MYLDKEFNQTETVKRTINPDFNHEKLFSFSPVTKQVSMLSASIEFNRVFYEGAREGGRDTAVGLDALWIVFHVERFL